MRLNNLNRKYIVQLILVYIPLLVTLVISFADVLPKYSVDYKIPLILILLIGSLFYSYILLLKNHINDLEEQNNVLIDSTNKSSENNQQPIRELRPSEIHHRLNGLSVKEKELLSKYLHEDTRTLRLHCDDPIADGLRLYGILEISSTVSTMRKYSYTLNAVYWDHLKKRPDAISL